MPKLPISSIAFTESEIGRLDILLARADDAASAGRRDEAMQLYRRILRIDPTCLQAINRLGFLSSESGDLITAVEQFENSARINPGQPDVWFNLGVAQTRLGMNQRALVSFGRVVALAPHSGAGHLERAANLARLGRHREARTAFDQAVRLMPADPTAAGQRGWALQLCGEYDEARKEYDRAIALRPDFAGAWVAKAMLSLLLEDLPGGFALYEWRWRLAAGSPERPGRGATQPLWPGEPGIAGKTLLISQEQGHGDVIQFCRYATVAADAGVRVIVEVRPELFRLVATLRGVSRVFTVGETRPDHDFHCPMISLPLAFNTTLETIPAPIPYLRADPAGAAEWRDRLAGIAGPRIGLVWAGGSRLGNAESMAMDQRRSLRLAEFAPLASVEGCTFVSLQLGPPAQQAKSPPEGMTVHDQTNEIGDFLDTAALVENLDLVISVDTAVAHLAGAMGKPVWLLNRFDTCWRWMLNRNDSPWYPTMRLFRQSQPGDWTPVMRSVAEALRAFVAARGR